MQERSAAVSEALECVTYLYLEQVNSALTNIEPYVKHKIWKTWVLYEIQRPKLPRVFQSLSDSVAAVFGIVKVEPPSRPAVEHDEQRQVVESILLSETSVSSLLKRSEAIFAECSLRFRGSSRIYITPSSTSGSVSMTLLQQDSLHCVLTNLSEIPLLSALEKAKDVLETIHAATLLNLSEG